VHKEELARKTSGLYSPPWVDLPHGKKLTRKVVFLGDSSVGKSSLMRRITHNEFNTFSESTIGAAYYAFTRGNIGLEMWDTAGAGMN